MKNGFHLQSWFLPSNIIFVYILIEQKSILYENFVNEKLEFIAYQTQRLDFIFTPYNIFHLTNLFSYVLDVCVLL